MKNKVTLTSLTLLLSLILQAQQPGEAFKKYFKGPLKVSQDNPRYFSDNSERAILLTGSHTWANFQEHYTEKQTATFDWEGYLHSGSYIIFLQQNTRSNVKFIYSKKRKLILDEI